MIRQIKWLKWIYLFLAILGAVLPTLANIEFGISEKLRMKGGLLSTKAKSHLENAQRIYEMCLTSDIKNTYAANGLGIVMAELGHAKAATDIFSKINEQSSMQLIIYFCFCRIIFEFNKSKIFS